MIKCLLRLLLGGHVVGIGWWEQIKCFKFIKYNKNLKFATCLLMDHCLIAMYQNCIGACYNCIIVVSIVARTHLNMYIQFTYMYYIVKKLSHCL
jgi:hypothetical protein